MAVTSNIALAYPDYVSSTWYTVILSDGSWTTDRPLNNVKSQIRKRVARSTDDAEASTKMKIDFGVARKVQFISLLNHNISTAGTVRFRFYSDSGYNTLVHDSTALNVWPGGSGGTFPNAEELNGYFSDFYAFLSAEITAQYCLVEISDTSNSAGYVEIGRVFVAPIWQPAINIEYGCSVGWEDQDTTRDRALGGTDWFDDKAKRRVAQVSLPVLTDAEAFKTVMEIHRRLGISGELYFTFDATDTTNWYNRQRSFLSRMSQLNPLQIPDYGINAAGFQFQEVI